jgi:flagellum-specific ATP synthase
MDEWSATARRVERLHPLIVCGTVTKVVGLIAEARGVQIPIGATCHILREDGSLAAACEAVGFREGSTLLMPYGDLHGVRPGSLVRVVGADPVFPVGHRYLGHVIDAFGHPLDPKVAIPPARWRPLYAPAPNPLSRPRIREPLDVGVRAINALLTLGKGQRVGIMAGSGVGKSTLMGMMARHTSADINVIGLVGERGREVVEFIENDLGPEGMARSVVLVATSDQSPLLRLRLAYAATTMAEFFRDEGMDVLLMMDSVTRFAMAAREIGLAAGEPPTTRGYTPTVFSHLPRLLERAGQAEKGSITGIYTVLVEGDDFNEPIADATRSILDGHIVLTRELADQGHFPAIDVLRSISRLAPQITPPEVRKAAQEVLAAMATYARAEDMISIGAYHSGSNPDIDRAISLIGPIRTFLRQGIHEKASMEESFAQLHALLAGPRLS